MTEKTVVFRGDEGRPSSRALFDLLDSLALGVSPTLDFL